MTPGDLPVGLSVRELVPRVDARGSLVEAFRDSWPGVLRPVQWNVVRSEPGVFRGFHVHVTHVDYLLMAAGRMTLGAKDIRKDSGTFGSTVILTVTADPPLAVTIPPGVAHGFCFTEPATHIYAVSEYWNPDDEMGCRWDDPAIGIEWPLSNPRLSGRDLTAGSYEAMVQLYEARSAAFRLSTFSSDGSRCP